VNGIYSNLACSADLRRDAQEISATKQIVAHLGGMLCAAIRRRPINWTFHWRGICRAIRQIPASLERGEKSLAQAQ